MHIALKLNVAPLNESKGLTPCPNNYNSSIKGSRYTSTIEIPCRELLKQT